MNLCSLFTADITGLYKAGFTQTILIHSGSELSGNITMQVKEDICPH
jgi:hypothetical protein